MYPDSGYKTTHAQSVCTGPFSRGEGPGDEATVYRDWKRARRSICLLLTCLNYVEDYARCACGHFDRPK